MFRAGLCFMLACGVSLPALAREKTTPDLPVRARVHLERGRQNHLLIPATVNGQKATFLLDTGEDECFVQKDRAAAFGIARASDHLRSGGQWFDAGQLDSLGIDGSSFPSVKVGLYDPSQFHGPVPGSGGRPADGIIGLKFLVKYRAIINCRTQELYVQDGSSSLLDLDEATKQLGFTRAPLTITQEGALTVPCTINAKPETIAVDTGAFVTIFDEASVRGLSLKESESKLTARTPAGKVRPLRLAQIDDLRIGGVRIPPQRFAVADLFTPIKPVRAFLGINTIQAYDERTVKVKQDIVGLLGSELLYQHSAIIDLSRRRLYLK